MMQCMIDHMEVISKICEKKEDLSSKLTKCCEKEFCEKSECIIKLENDDKPADLLPHVRKFIEDPGVCNHTLDQQKLYMAKFSYEYSRRHSEFSVHLLKRITDGFERMLPFCCSLGYPLQCFQKGEELMQNLIGESKKFVKKNCDDLQNMGDYNFQNELLIRWARKLPEALTTSLIDLTQNMVNLGTACCKVDETKRMPCTEGGLSLIIGDICRRQKGTSTNSVLSECCNEPYSTWRPCFTLAHRNKNYMPPEFNPDQFKFGADLCSITSPTDLRIQKQTFLVQLVKLKIDIEPEQLKQIIAGFLTMVDQCCKSGDQEKCFVKEGPKLFEHCRDVLNPNVKVEAAATV